MKKLVLVAVLSLLPTLAKADLKDQIKLTLIDHVEVVSQVRSDGQVSPALLDTVVQIGHFYGTEAAKLQLGFVGDTKPSSSDHTVNVLGGLVVRLDPLFKSKVTLPEHWEFLKALEFGPALNYDFTNKIWFGSVQFSLAFRLNPVQ